MEKFAQVCTESGVSLCLHKFAQTLRLHKICTRFHSRNFPQKHIYCLQTLNIFVTVWEMKTLNEAIAGSGGNALLIGSSPVVGTTLVFGQ